MNKIKLKQIEEITANNIVMSEDLVVTKSVGEITVPAGGSVTISKTIEGAARSIANLLDTIFSKEVQPSISRQPNVDNTTIAYNSISVKPTPLSVEYGTILDRDLTVKVVFDSGAYSTNNPNPTGVQILDNSAKFDLLSGAESIFSSDCQNNTPTTFNLSELTTDTKVIRDLTARIFFRHSEGLLARTNKGNESNPGVKIVSGEKTKTWTIITPHYKGFYGMSVVDEIPLTTDAANAIIRALHKTSSNPVGGALPNFNADELGAETPKAIIIALPRLGQQTDKKVIKVEQLNGLVTDITGDFTHKDIMIRDANGDGEIPYRVWISTPQSITTTNIYKVILG